MFWLAFPQRLSICPSHSNIGCRLERSRNKHHDMAHEKSVAPLQECDLVFSRVLVSSCFFLPCYFGSVRNFCFSFTTFLPLFLSLFVLECLTALAKNPLIIFLFQLRTIPAPRGGYSSFFFTSFTYFFLCCFAGGCNTLFLSYMLLCGWIYVAHGRKGCSFFLWLLKR